VNERLLQARLLYALPLAMAATFVSGMVLLLALERFLFGLVALPPALSRAVLLVAVASHSWLLWRRLPPALLEPCRPLADGRLRRPRPSDHRLVLRLAGQAFLGLAALELFFLLDAGARRGLFVPGGLPSLALLAVKMGLAALLGASCLRLARRGWSSPAGTAAGAAGALTTARLVEAAQVAIEAAVLATAGMLLGYALSSGELLRGPGWLGQATLARWGAHGGAILAIHLMRLERRQRWVLSAGLVAEALGTFLIGPAGALLVMLAVVLLLERGLTPGSGGGARRAGWWAAARAAWAFALGALGGKLLGRLAGGLAFGLFGPVGPITGEALGQVLLGLAAYLWLRLPAGDGVAASGPPAAEPTSVL
jgi:hypothetical protein